uniref:Uncharacterized protein n=1 Tax=Tetranychus urticae TaxID=32264 RepID=T1KL27_TETUR
MFLMIRFLNSIMPRMMLGENKLHSKAEKIPSHMKLRKV